MRLLVLVFTLLIWIDSVLAEESLNLCDGVWTTKACEEPEKVIEAIESSPAVKEAAPVVESKETFDRASILHPLNMKVIEIRDEYKEEYDIESVEYVCSNSSEQACREAVSKELESVREYELKLKKLALEEKQLEESEISKKDENSVTVNQVTTVINRGRRRRSANQVFRNDPPVLNKDKLAARHQRILNEREARSSP